MQRMYMVDVFIRGLFSFGGMVNSSYISVSAWMFVITWESRKGPI